MYFNSGDEGNRFAFAAMPQIEVRLGQELTSGARPLRSGIGSIPERQKEKPPLKVASLFDLG